MPELSDRLRNKALCAMRAAELGSAALRFRSTRELEQAIRDYITSHDAQPKPFHWTKTAASAKFRVVNPLQIGKAQATNVTML